MNKTYCISLMHLSRISLFFCSFVLFEILSAQTTYSILGDSYSTFKGYVTPKTNLCFYRPVSKFNNNVHEVTKTWWWILQNNMGYKLLVNNSYSGSTICNTGYAKNDYSDRSFIARMTNIGQPDILFIFGGTNDCWAEVPLGEFQYENWGKSDLYKFRPAFSYLLYHLKQEHPKMRIINICNSDLEGEYNASMEIICRHYHVENIQLEHIKKQEKHPSIVGMKQISIQIETLLKNTPWR